MQAFLVKHSGSVFQLLLLLLHILLVASTCTRKMKKGGKELWCVPPNSI